MCSVCGRLARSGGGQPKSRNKLSAMGDIADVKPSLFYMEQQVDDLGTVHAVPPGYVPSQQAHFSFFCSWAPLTQSLSARNGESIRSSKGFGDAVQEGRWLCLPLFVDLLKQLSEWKEHPLSGARPYIIKKMTEFIEEDIPEHGTEGLIQNFCNCHLQLHVNRYMWQRWLLFSYDEAIRTLTRVDWCDDERSYERSFGSNIFEVKFMILLKWRNPKEDSNNCSFSKLFIKLI